MVGGFYYYFSELLGPLSAHEAAIEKEIPTLENQLKEARIQINRTRSIEAADANAVSARECFAVMKSTIPEGSPLAWLPQRFSDYFKRQGIAKATFRFNAEAAEPDLPGYKNSVWTIDLPRVEFLPLGIAVAGLENQEGLLQITNVQVMTAGPASADPTQHAQLTVSTVVKQ